MTRIIAMQHDNEYRLECRDHAESVEVCAAISALCYTLAGTAINHDNIEDVHYDLTPGYSLIMYQSDEERADEDFRFCVLGLLQIQESHPDEVSVIQNIFD